MTRRPYKEPLLCDFNEIKMKVPRVRLVKLAWKKGLLDHDEAVFLKGLLLKSEAVENRLKHIQSLINKALLKSYSRK